MIILLHSISNGDAVNGDNIDGVAGTGVVDGAVDGAVVNGAVDGAVDGGGAAAVDDGGGGGAVKCVDIGFNGSADKAMGLLYKIKRSSCCVVLSDIFLSLCVFSMYFLNP
jgi:hypothetical protein